MSRSGRGGARRERRRIRDATRNLERAVEELASAATDEVSDRAAGLLDAAAARVRGESGSDRYDSEDEPRRRDRASKRAHYRDYEDLSRRSRGLSLDRENRKIVGVCAGIARYLGIEAWMARCVALTGLIFMPSVVFPAYWVAFFVMGHSPSDRGRRLRRARAGGRAERRPGARRRRRRYRRSDRDHRARASASASGVRFSPRQSLRAAQADFAEVELRLRRIEAFVTSDRYALERGFAEIGANATPRSASDQHKEQ